MRIAAYEIEALIGRGGVAEVYRGRIVGGPRAGAPVAVKRLLSALAGDPAHVALFEREARLATVLRHPGIVSVLEAGIDAGLPYIAMEYVDGRDLGRLLAACGARSIRLPLDFALHVAHAVAEALHHAHRARGDDGRPLGIVHCDVSPSNVFVSRAGEVKLGDFGVARAAGEGRGRAAFGKVRYLAHELLTGSPAFAVGDAGAVASRILSGARRPPSADRPEVTPEVDAIVLRALSLAPDQRHQDAGAMAEELASRYDPPVGNPLAIAALVRGLAPA